MEDADLDIDFWRSRRVEKIDGQKVYFLRVDGEADGRKPLLMAFQGMAGTHSVRKRAGAGETPVTVFASQKNGRFRFRVDQRVGGPNFAEARDFTQRNQKAIIKAAKAILESEAPYRAS